MRDTKSFASLSSGLLARKGQARPAMRPQGGFGMNLGGYDDLGWNDMGRDVAKPETARFGALQPQPAPAAPTIDTAPVIAPIVAEVKPAATNLTPPATMTPGTPPVVRQQEQLAEAMAAMPEPIAADPVVAEPDEAEPVAAEPVIAETAAPEPAKAAGKAKTVALPRDAGRKAAFTLRLEAERHLRLRLACAVQNRSAQQIVTAALDRFLGDVPDVERLATSLSAPDAGRK